ncbi:MAG: NAD(P)H-quinone oxidoreductase subunit 4, partial [Cuspidothrix sp.]
ELHLDAVFLDIKPRELFITACLIVPIIGIGFYPKMITQAYDVKTVKIAAHTRQVLPVIAHQQPANLYSQIFTTPTLANSEVVNIVE